MKNEYFTLNGSRYHQEETTGLVYYVGPALTKTEKS